ncbi:MAG TPA: DNA mismatch repair protein MutS [Treponema sp.]|jgi:DNA-nicking Smr family endonuclease|nr:DNA mismatch repair protein MutS [Treponema sp.]HCA19804.1 DNA mismatch repair protein MutS [Treponema sp.]
MNFADILDEWDSIQKSTGKQPQGKKQKKNQSSRSLQADYERQMEEDNNKKANPIDVWLNQHGTINKDKIADQAEQESLLHNRSYLKNMRPQAVIDLHGLTRDEAWARLNGFVSDCIRKNLRKILIIHGKGNHNTNSDPVLGEMVQKFIEQDKRLGTSGHPDRNNGGSGATWVLIKQNA